MATGCAAGPGTPPAAAASPGASAPAGAASPLEGVPLDLPTPVAATPAPDRPLGPPEAATWTFGTVEATWRSAGEQAAIYDLRERFAGKPLGSSTGYYLRLDGRVYAIHWDEAAKHAALTPGTRANLYPAEHVVCIADPSHPTRYRCWRLMRIVVANRRLPPLSGM